MSSFHDVVGQWQGTTLVLLPRLPCVSFRSGALTISTKLNDNGLRACGGPPKRKADRVFPFPRRVLGERKQNKSALTVARGKLVQEVGVFNTRTSFW